jgi:hypothetical protein
VGEDTGRVVQLTVALRDVSPPVWRRLAVPTSLTLRELHEVIQAAMGWQGYHLHLFEVDGVLYGDVEDFPGRLGDEDKTTVGRVAAAVRGFRYEYDFGDSWEHDITVEGVSADEGSDRPRVVGGARACPPEDCGGSPGYAQLLEVLADPSHDEYAQALDWVGGSFDAEAFDPATADGVLSALWAART